ncbi:Na/Pi symporter, partial [Candidatus Eisenbacteria bacterium]
MVSLGHVTHRHEFERAFAAATVHDFFNVMAVLVLFPLECLFHPIEHVAAMLQGLFAGAGGLHLMSPLKAVIRPVTGAVSDLLPYGVPLLFLALVALFTALSQMVRIMRMLVMTRVERFFNRILFRNDGAGFVLGWLLTSIVQSSSATTSLIVPLVGTGVLTVRRVFSYTLGANLGTTVTAMLASFATANPVAITVAFAHMVFNILGIVIFYPLRRLPISLATKLGTIAAVSRRNAATVVAVYIAAYLVPIAYILVRYASGK